MSNRCPNCNKFVGLELQDPEINSTEIDDVGNVTINARLVLACADCGEEMKDYEFELSDEISEVAEHLRENPDHEVSIEEDDSSYTERYQDQDSKGKKIPYRFQKHFYGVEVNATITCECGQTFEITLSDECQASWMNELN